jgi:plasmid stability protein
VAAVVVRNLADETLRALKERAASNGRSTEAEIREILTSAVRRPMAVGSALARIGRALGGVELAPRAKRGPVRPARFARSSSIRTSPPIR